MIIDLNEQKVEIIYPCRWLYKVICSDRENVRRAVEEIVESDSCRITDSNSSRTGKYHSLNVEVEVRDEQHRNSLYVSLQAVESVRMVL